MMAHEFLDGQKDDKEKYDSPKGQEESDLHKSALAKTSMRENSDHTFILNMKRSQSSRRCTNSAIFERVHGLDSRIPKDMVSLDEKYLRHCLELIHSNASKVASFRVSVNLTSSAACVPSDSLNLTNPFRVTESLDCSTKLFLDCSLATRTGKVVATTAGHGIVGSIMGSKSMINIMRNPLFHRSRTLGGNFGISKSRDLKDLPLYEVVSSPSQLSLCSSMEQGKETAIFGAHNNYRVDTKHQRFISVTSTSSTSTGTDASSLSTSVPAVVSQGMLHITWKGGIPHFVFSLDEQKEIYVTSLTDTGPRSSGAPQHLYLFYSRPHGHKNVVHDKELNLLVGRMKVTTSLSLCLRESKVVETEFVLSTSCEPSPEQVQTSANSVRRNKGLPKKMVGFFRNSHSSKNRRISRFDGTTSPILENILSDTSKDACSNLDALGSNEILRSHTPADFELAAIVVRTPSRDSEKQVEGGGWGLKFLRRVGVKKIPETSDETSPCDCCTRNAENCSTSINVIIPVGIHGGPRTRNGGPSSLTERWKFGGQCDCGGWDLGCPLTVLKTRATEEVLSGADIQGNIKPFDLYLQGSKQCVPCLRMMNVHEGLYLIHFQSTLSALQSFSIAVAHIHSQSPILQPKLVG